MHVFNEFLFHSLFFQTNKETKMLKIYSAQYQKLLVYSNPVNIDQALEQIETCLKESNDSCI